MNKILKKIGYGLAVLGLVLTMGGTQAFAAFGYYRSITVDYTKVPSTQTDFPVGIIGTYTELKATGSGGRVIDAQGDDIGFYTNSDCATGKMKWEKVQWTSTTGAVEYWVKVASLSGSVNTVFYMCYGDSGVTTDQSDSANTWDTNFRGVLHFGDGTTINTNDTSSYALTGTNNGVTATAGQVGGAGDFASDYINFGDNMASSMTGDFTLSYWGNATNWTQVFSKSPGGTGIAKPFDGYIFYTGQQRLWVGDGTLSESLIESAAAPTSTWTYYTWKLSGTSWTVRKNGAADNSGTLTIATTRADGTENLLIGHNNPGSEYFAGRLDEMRASSVARSNDWDTAAYNNQSSPSTFYSVGTETAIGGGSAIKTWNAIVNAVVKVWNGITRASVKSWNGLQ